MHLESEVTCGCNLPVEVTFPSHSGIPVSLGLTEPITDMGESPLRVVRTAWLVRRISLPFYVDVVRAAEVAEFTIT